MVKTCKKCGVVLTAENWKTYCKCIRWYICNMCHKLYWREHYKKHKNYLKVRRKKYVARNRRKLNEYARNYCKRPNIVKIRREHVLGTVLQGKRVLLRGNKRPYPEDNKCEICARRISRSTGKQLLLHYHHWSNTHLLSGVWVCQHCHIMAEKVDKGYHEKYLKIKNLRSEKYLK